MTRIALLALAATALAACSPAGASGDAPALKPKHAAPPLIAGALPPPPAWAQPYMGRILTQMLPQKDGCAGNTDRRLNLYSGPPAGSAVGGWAWDKQAKQPITQVLLTDETLRVWGAAEGGEEREDVPRRMPEVQSPRTGWRGYDTGTSGLVVAWGLVEGGRAICPLGELEL